mgnify:CR=1 FL=1
MCEPLTIASAALTAFGTYQQHQSQRSPTQLPRVTHLMQLILPHYLPAYRAGGRFGDKKLA